MFDTASLAGRDIHDGPTPGVLPDLGLSGQDRAVVDILLGGLELGSTGICLCDETDTIRYVNAMFRSAFLPVPCDHPMDFTATMAHSIRHGQGIHLQSLPLDAFVTKIRTRRRSSRGSHSFAVDLTDGRWWWVNDYKLDNGWILALASDISTVKDEEFRLRHAHALAVKAAQTDYLTSLANRRFGFEQAEAALAAFDVNRLAMTVAIVDIDHFKRINDLFGHEVGDRVLMHFAKVLIDRSDPRDQVSRIGGEEFMLVMPDMSGSRALHKLDELLRTLPPLAMPELGQPLAFTISAGLAGAERGENFTALLRRADVALYAAKARGRNRVELCRQTAQRSLIDIARQNLRGR